MFCLVRQLLFLLMGKGGTAEKLHGIGGAGNTACLCRRKAGKCYTAMYENGITGDTSEMNQKGTDLGLTIRTLREGKGMTGFA